jgi:5-methylcytosine-specific restriction endonuclease McrA
MDGLGDTIQPYQYPSRPHERRHGPRGYSAYESYRPWLEDEFTFRCIYCLNRKVWSPTNIWAIDHLVSQDEKPELATDYDNLVFACQFCNQQKLANRVPDPCRIAYGECLRVETNGEITALNREGRRLVEVIRLNHPRFVEERLKMLRLTKVLAKHAPGELEKLMGFPDILPNLTSLRPPGGNGRPNGILASHFGRRQQGELPKVY